MITAIIITRDEETRIKICLESVKWADQIIVADTGSQDKTLDIAGKYTKDIILCKGKNFSQWRSEAMFKANSDWVLFIDADERVTGKLKEELLTLSKTGAFSAYAISRINFIFGNEVRYGPFWPDWVIRFIKKADFLGYEGDIHEQPKFNGALGYTKNSLIHLTHRNVDQIILKNLHWSRIDARLRLEANHPPVTSWRLLRILITELFNQGIIRKGFFSGTVGTMDALLQTFSMLTSYIRLWEMQQPKTRDQFYADLDIKLMDDNFNI